MLDTKMITIYAFVDINATLTFITFKWAQELFKELLIQYESYDMPDVTPRLSVHNQEDNSTQDQALYVGSAQKVHMDLGDKL